MVGWSTGTMLSIVILTIRDLGWKGGGTFVFGCLDCDQNKKFCFFTIHVKRFIINVIAILFKITDALHH